MWARRQCVVTRRFLCAKENNVAKSTGKPSGAPNKHSSSSSSSARTKQKTPPQQQSQETAALLRLDEAVGRMKPHSQEIARRRVREILSGPSEEPAGGLEHGWWRLASRRRRSPSLGGRVTALATSWMVQYAGLMDGRFEEGATRALEALHEAMADGDEQALGRFCDEPLASTLRSALSEARESDYRVEHGAIVVGRPRVSWWRIAIGLERGGATWETDADGNAVVADDWCALDERSRIGLLLVLPRDQFEPVRLAFETGSYKALYDAVSTAMDENTVSVQAAVDFADVREALVVWKGDGNSPDDFWTGSTDGFVPTRRQLLFESPAFRQGFAVDQPDWRLVDVDNLLDGGAPYWRFAIPPADHHF